MSDTLSFWFFGDLLTHSSRDLASPHRLSPFCDTSSTVKSTESFLFILHRTLLHHHLLVLHPGTLLLPCPDNTPCNPPTSTFHSPLKLLCSSYLSQNLRCVSVQWTFGPRNFPKFVCYCGSLNTDETSVRLYERESD